MARVRNYDRVNKFVNHAIDIANNDSHGYSQYHRWGPDYDCSSLMYECAYFAGYNVSREDPRYTGAMIEDFTAAGFQCLPFDGNLGDLDRGDILLNTSYHTAVYIGDGLLVEASIDERGGIAGSQNGDQTGHEIHVRSAYNYPWTNVLCPPVDWSEIPDPGPKGHVGSLWDYHGDLNQKMSVIHNEDGTVTFIDCKYGLALDVTGDPGTCGVLVNFIAPNGSDWQRWYTQQMPFTSKPDNVAPYVLIPKMNGGFALDADSKADGSNGTRLQLWKNESATNRNQSWYIEDNLDGTWTIRSVKWPNKVVDAGAEL